MKAKAKELDRKFDSGEDIMKYLDLTKARRPARDLTGVPRDGDRGLLSPRDHCTGTSRRILSGISVPRRFMFMTR